MEKDDFSFSLSEDSVNGINVLIEHYSEDIVNLINGFQNELIGHLSSDYYDKLLRAVDGIIELYNDSVQTELKQRIFEKWKDACESMTSFSESMEMGEESETVASDIEECLSGIFDAQLENRLKEVEIEGKTGASAYDFERIKEIFSGIVTKVQQLSDDFSSQIERLGEENELYSFLLPVITAYSAGIAAFFEQSRKQLGELEDNYLNKMKAKRDAALEGKKETDYRTMLDFSDLAHLGMGERSQEANIADDEKKSPDHMQKSSASLSNAAGISDGSADGSTDSGSDIGDNLSESATKKIKEKITGPHCEEAREIAQSATKDGERDAASDDMGKNFTSHNEDHLEQVREKTSEALGVMVIAIKDGEMEREGAIGDIHFEADVDFKVIQAAAEVHDTGMSDQGYAFDCDDKKIPKCDKNGNIIVLKQNPRDFNSVRNNHSANSALNVLKKRDFYKTIGFTDAQVDEIAVLVYVHTKSYSGVADLNNSKLWSECFNRIEALKNKYNDDHPDKKISLTRSRFEGASNARKLGSLATEALALRIGDVSRSSGPGAVSQSGEVMSVSKKETPIIETPKGWREEIKNFEVKRGNTILEVEPLPKGTNDPKLIDAYKKEVDKIEKSKQVHIGEQNIVDNHTDYINGTLIHTVTVNQGNHAPYCTAEALSDHFGELCSAHNLKAVMRVEFKDVCTPETQAKYNERRDNIYDEIRKKMYENKEAEGNPADVRIIFPWDRGEINV